MPIKRNYYYSIFALVVGTVFMVSGFLLFLLGILGATDWTIKLFGLESRLIGSFGIAFAILGFLIIFVTRYKPHFHIQKK